MRRNIAFLALAALVAVGGPAAATGLSTQPNCVLLTGATPGVGYQNACALHEQGWRFAGEGYDYSYSESRLLSASEAHDFGPFATWGFDTVRQREFRYFDSWGSQSSEHAGNGTEVSSVRAVRTGAVGAGYVAGMEQDQRAFTDCHGGCTTTASQRTDVGASAYLSTRAAGSVGAGVSYGQSDHGQGCQEQASAGVSFLVGYEHVPLAGPEPCAAALPQLRDATPFPAWPALLPTS